LAIPRRLCGDEGADGSLRVRRATMSSTDGKPRARVEGLVTRQLESGETVVYDRSRDRVHCLNRTAALVWQHCNGTNTLRELGEMLQRETGLPSDDAVVDLALGELRKAKLLDEAPERLGDAPTVTRRQALERIGYGAAIAAMLPVVASLVAPKPAAAASCLPVGAGCGSNGDCCSNNCLSGICAPGSGGSPFNR
jgi:hypothetical protein